jgi:hypothetical protein
MRADEMIRHGVNRRILETLQASYHGEE